jgi:hypothetical protein
MWVNFNQTGMTMNKLMIISLILLSTSAFSYKFGQSPAEQNRMIQERMANEMDMQNTMLRNEINRQNIERIGRR